jgi:CRP-like cAMP-binding protein
MNKTKEYSRGTVVFREGETGNSMYNIDFGKVGVYRGYGTKDEKQIA